MASSDPERRLAAILSADIAGYSRLMADDETATIETLTTYRSAIEGALEAHRGRLVDFTGDNFLAEFGSALDGVRCAVEIQRALGARNDALPLHRRMEFRIGLHLGDVRIEDTRIYGDGVNIAARLEGLAEPGGICVSSNVYDLVRSKLELTHVDLGAQRVKNIAQPVRAYRVTPGSPGTRPSGTAPARRSLLIVAGLVAVVISGILLWRTMRDAAPDALLALPNGPSIAVLPFENLSNDPDQEYFSDGLTEDIITSLSRFQSLFVIARHSTFQYKGRVVDVREVGRELGVRYLLEGSVRQAGERLRVTAQLSDANDGRHLWGEAYDRDRTAGDLFTIQDELTQHVVGEIAGSYGAISRAGLAETRRKTTDSLDAYDCILRTYEYLQMHTAANHLVARDCLERAVEIDPEYPDTWAWLAYTYAEEHRHSWNVRPEVYDSLDRALEVANRAVALDSANQVAHGALALTHFGRREFDRFAIEADRAIALNPNSALWLGLLGTYFAEHGDLGRGMPMVRKALALNPTPPGWLSIPFFLDHYQRGRYEKALAEAQKITTEDFYRHHLFLAAAYGQLGRREEARKAIEKLLALRSDFPDSTYEDLRDNYGYPDELTAQLMEGLRKAGIEDAR